MIESQISRWQFLENSDDKDGRRYSFAYEGTRPAGWCCPMIAIIFLLPIITVSVLVTRLASIALTHTGLSHESARFQARSAFTRLGFTTSESERVVSHPVRRRVVMLLMLLGNAGIVTAMSSLILAFVQLVGT